jgi:ABC-2 type transport system permease protein
MQRTLIKKSLREASVLFAGCALAALSFAWFRVWLVSELDTSRFQQILDLLPQDWRRFATVDFDWLITYMGRTAMALEEPMIAMLIGIWAMVRGSDVVSGEVGRGTMEMLLAQPVSRRRVYWTQIAVTLAGVVALGLIIWFGMWLGVESATVHEARYPEIRIPIIDWRFPLTFLEPASEAIPMNARVDAWLYGYGILNVWALGLFLTGVSAFCSSWDRYRWRTLGIVVSFYIGSEMLKILALSSDRFGWVMWLTFFGCFEPEAAVQVADQWPAHAWDFWGWSAEGALNVLGPSGRNLVLAAWGTVTLIVGSIIFSRRDLPAPL